MRATDWLDRRLYPASSGAWDNVLFRDWVLPHLHGTERVLDLGAGAGIIPQMDFRARAKHVVGVDLDPRVLTNPFLHEAHVADAGALPVPDAAFDVVVCNNVLEHFAEPERVFREVHRVLRPGGSFFAKTPNARHYVAVIARCTPPAFHGWISRRRGRSDEDTFPTLYRANSRRDLARIAASAGLRLESLRYVEGRPEYLRMWTLTYLAGALYERVVNRFDGLAAWRVVILVQMRRPTE